MTCNPSCGILAMGRFSPLWTFPRSYKAGNRFSTLLTGRWPLPFSTITAHVRPSFQDDQTESPSASIEQHRPRGFAPRPRPAGLHLGPTSSAVLWPHSTFGLYSSSTLDSGFHLPPIPARLRSALLVSCTTSTSTCPIKTMKTSCLCYLPK